MKGQLNIQNQSTEGAITCVRSYVKVWEKEKKGREMRKRVQEKGNENKKQECRR